MRRLTNMLLAATIALAIALGLPGCGGGGGTGGGVKPVLRSMNVGSSVLTVDARFEWQLHGYWTGDNTPDVPAMLDSLTGDPTMADIWLAGDNMSGYVAPKIASGRFTLSVKSTHPNNVTPPDPQAGTQETFTLPVGINPGNVSAPGNSLKLPEDGKAVLYVYSTTSRATGAVDNVVSLIPPAPSRAQRLCPVRWTDSGGLGTFTPNPSTTALASTYQLNRGALGTTTLVGTALDSAGNEMPALKVTVAINQIVPHPTLNVSGLTDGETISASRTVSVTTTNAAVTRWQLDATPAVDFAGQFTIDPASLTEGQHTIKVSALGELESVTNIYSVTVTHPYDPGRRGSASFSSTSVSTNSDGKGTLVSSLHRFADGGYVCSDKADTLRFFDSSLNAVATATPGGVIYKCAVVGNRVWVGCGSANAIKIYDRSGNLVDTVSAGGSFTRVTFCPESGKILAAGSGGVREYDTSAPYNYTTIVGVTATAATGDSRYVFYATSSGVYSIPRSGGTPTSLGAHGAVYDMYAVPGFNLVMIVNGSSKSLDQILKDGDAVTSASLPNGDNLCAIGVDSTFTAGFVPCDASSKSYTWQVSPM